MLDCAQTAAPCVQGNLTLQFFHPVLAKNWNHQIFWKSFAIANSWSQHFHNKHISHVQGECFMSNKAADVVFEANTPEFSRFLS